MGFRNLISLIVFQGSLLLFVTFGVMLGKYVCWTRNCDLSLASSFFVYVKFHSTQGSVIGNMN